MYHDFDLMNMESLTIMNALLCTSNAQDSIAFQGGIIVMGTGIAQVDLMKMIDFVQPNHVQVNSDAITLQSA